VHDGQAALRQGPEEAVVKKRGRKTSEEKGAEAKTALTESYRKLHDKDYTRARKLRSSVINDKTVAKLVQSKDEQAVRAAQSLESFAFTLGSGDQISAAIEILLKRPLMRTIRNTEVDEAATMKMCFENLKSFLKRMQPNAGDGSHRGTRSVANEAATQAILTGLGSKDVKA
jgi:hypothetical protein